LIYIDTVKDNSRVTFTKRTTVGFSLARRATLEFMQTAYIGMGANIPSPAGPPEATLAAAANRLGSIGRVVCRSSLYSTAPVGFADQPRFVNAAIALETDLSPASLLAALLRIEREFGRDRSAGILFGPRTLDLDILLLGSLVLHEFDLDIPHPRLAERAFVLIPLHEIASKVMVVSRQRTVKQLLQDLRSGLPTESNEVIPLSSDLWRAGPCGDGDVSPLRPGVADPGPTRSSSADPDR
jgi:2-amino-4-hydroxy-6-hydroxymethyldihydropteridine diphosphokinase